MAHKNHIVILRDSATYIMATLVKTSSTKKIPVCTPNILAVYEMCEPGTRKCEKNWQLCVICVSYICKSKGPHFLRLRTSLNFSVWFDFSRLMIFKHLLHIYIYIYIYI